MWVLKRERGGLALRVAEDLQRLPSAPAESNLSPAGKSGRGQETGGGGGMDTAGADKWHRRCAIVYLTRDGFILIQVINVFVANMKLLSCRMTLAGYFSLK